MKSGRLRRDRAFYVERRPANTASCASLASTRPYMPAPQHGRPTPDPGVPLPLRFGARKQRKESRKSSAWSHPCRAA